MHDQKTISGTRLGASHEPMAELERASKRYGSVTALEAVDFVIKPGEVVALLGPNGAGKTTLIQLLLGLLRPSSGQVQLFGRDPKETVARTRLGVMLQVSRVPETLKVREHVRLVSSYYPQPLPLDRVIELAGLKGLEDRHFGRLSGGQKQRVLFGLAICGNPDLLFLDEPTTGLDIESRRGLWETIGHRVGSGRSVLLTTHNLEEADILADRIVLLDRGRVLAEGTPAEIKARVPGRKIRCRTALSASELRQLPAVRSVAAGTAGAAVELFTTEAEETLRALFAQDSTVAGLEVRGADLEEAFLNWTTGGSAARTEEVAA
jgi:ABC-2 type transport system ATP-binding protein